MEKYGNYLGVLKWSLQQNDGTKPSEVKPMSKEVGLCKCVELSVGSGIL